MKCIKPALIFAAVVSVIVAILVFYVTRKIYNPTDEEEKEAEGYTTVSGSGGGGMFKSVFAGPREHNYMNYGRDDRYGQIPANRDAIPTPRHSASGIADIGAHARYKMTEPENMATFPDDPLAFHQILQENQNHSDENGRGDCGHARKVDGMLAASGQAYSEYPDVEDSAPVGDMTNSHVANLMDPSGKVRNPVYVNSIMGGFVPSNVKPERQSGDPALMIRGSAPINSDTVHFKNWERADMFLPHQAKMDQMRSLTPGAFQVFGETSATDAHRALQRKYTRRARQALAAVH